MVEFAPGSVAQRVFYLGYPDENACFEQIVEENAESEELAEIVEVLSTLGLDEEHVFGMCDLVRRIH